MSEPITSPQFLTAPQLEPWLGRAMAGDFGSERYSFGDLEDPHPSKILLTRSEPGQRFGELYKDMLQKDTGLAGITYKVSDAVMALPRAIVPRNDTPLAKEIAVQCREALSQIEAFDLSIEHQLRSDGPGVAFEEMIWARHDRGGLRDMLTPVDLIDRPMHRFGFKQGRLHVRNPITGQLEIAPAGKFIGMRHGTKDSAWGLPKLDDVYWPTFIKKAGWKWFALYIEKYAAPTAVGEYDHRTDADGKPTANTQKLIADLLAVLEALQSNSSVAVPKSTLLRYLEQNRSGNVSYESFIELCERSQALYWNGEINTSGLRSSTGSFASDKIADGIRIEKVVRRAKSLGAHFTSNLLRLIVQVNWGPDAPAPRFVIDTSSLEERKDRREGAALLAEYELPIAKRQIYGVAGFDEPRPGEEVVVGKKKVVPPALGQPPVPGAEADPATDDDDTTPEDSAAPREKVMSSPRALRLAAADNEAKASLRQAKQRDQQIEEAAAAQRPAFLQVFAEQQRLVSEAWDAGERAGLLGSISRRLDPRPLADALHATLVTGAGLSCQHLVDDGLPLASFARPRRTAPAGQPTQATFAALPEGAAGATNGRTAIEFWQGLLGLSPDLFSTIVGGAGTHASLVAGSTYGGMLVQLHQLIARAIADGWTREQFRAELAALYAQHGLSEASDWKADLVLANGTRTAYGLARYEQLVLNPAAHRLIPYLAWRTLDDDVVRERRRHNHRIVHDVVFAISHEFWKTWWFPAGHNCRCYVATISKPAARRLGYTGAEPLGPWPTTEDGRALPDPGFYTPIDLATDALRAQDQVDSLLANAAAIDSQSLLDALNAALNTLNLRGAQ